MSRSSVEAVLDEIEQAFGRRPKFFDAASGYAGLESALGMPVPSRV